MSDRPLISICIPAYNRPEGLRSALESIVLQKGFDDEVEVLVIDDASPIDTRESAKPFYEKFKNIRYIKNKTNLGFEKNILKLFKTFRGQYFFFLSDDDQLLPEALTKIKKLIRTYPDCTVFSSGYELVLEKQKKTVSHRIFEESKIISRKQIKDVVKLYSDTHALSRVVLRRDAIDTNGFKRHIGSMYPHMYVIGKAALTGNAYYTSELLLRHAAENEVFWEYKDDYMIKGQIKMIKDLARIDERFYKEAFPALVIRPIPYITYHALRRSPQAFIRLVLALSAIPEIGYNPLVWFKIGTQMIFQSFAKFSNILLLFIIALFLWFFYLNLNTPGFLNFSDGAKFADIARNVVNGFGYGGNFNFFGTISLEQAKQFPFPAPWAPPAMPLSIAGAFKILGITDFAVIATSGFFYVLLVLTTFLLGRQLFGNLIGFLSGVAVAANLNFLDYATSGASEVLFAFEVVLAAYLFILGKKWATIFGFLILILMYFTRPQAFLFIAGFIFLWLLLKYDLKRALLISLTLGIVGLVIDGLILQPLAGRFFLYPILGRGIYPITQALPSISTSEALRGAYSAQIDIVSVLKKVFFNLYNFYKLLPQIASPYIWALFAIALFQWGKDKTVNALKVVTLLLVIGIFLVTALTIPFFRYIHPVIPLVYLFATATLIWLIEQIVKIDWKLVIGNWKFKIKKDKAIALVSTFLIFVFVVGQTLGVIFLDSRFWAARRNIGKPPVYVQLSWILRDNTGSSDVVVTNLDTWGSWYGERKTVWFPLEPKQLIDPETGKVPFDAIYLTSYLMDDENYYMGTDWRQIFENPKDPKKWACDGCDQIVKEFTLKDIYKVAAEETYEKQDASAILLIKKHGE